MFEIEGDLINASAVMAIHQHSDEPLSFYVRLYGDDNAFQYDYDTEAECTLAFNAAKLAWRRVLDPAAPLR